MLSCLLTELQATESEHASLVTMETAEHQSTFSKGGRSARRETRGISPGPEPPEPSHLSAQRWLSAASQPRRFSFNSQDLTFKERPKRKALIGCQWPRVQRSRENRSGFFVSNVHEPHIRHTFRMIIGGRALRFPLLLRISLMNVRSKCLIEL